MRAVQSTALAKFQKNVPNRRTVAENGLCKPQRHCTNASLLLLLELLVTTNEQSKEPELEST
jgi:hypothetical protein